jgi:hypothetical protein
MNRCDVEALDHRQTYWVLSVVAPQRNWSGAPGCRRGARFLVDGTTRRASRDNFETFESELGCLQWIMLHRAELNSTIPGTRLRAVPLNRWLLGLE